MAYTDYTDYAAAVKNPVDEAAFARLLRDAERIMDIHTTGIDNVRKLRIAYPADEMDAEAVRLCACRLVELLGDIEAAEEKAASAATESGAGRVIASKSSGSESVSYSLENTTTAADRVVGGKEDRAVLCRRIVTEYLSGVADANGVNLLYRGRYPYVL